MVFQRSAVRVIVAAFDGSIDEEATQPMSSLSKKRSSVAAFVRSQAHERGWSRGFVKPETRVRKTPPPMIRGFLWHSCGEGVSRNMLNEVYCLRFHEELLRCVEA